jgi:hypothetical protein
MKKNKVLRYLAIFLIIVVLVIGSVLSYVKMALPNVGPAPDIKVELTPERIKRGEYLANHVTLCMDCHSKRDWTRFSGPIMEGGIGGGGERFDEKVGFPGVYYSKNITPYHLKDWTDGEIFRTITTGVNREGKALFPVMPYVYYSKMDKEDIYSIIAYVRTLPSVKNDPLESSSNFPMNFIINTIPSKAEGETIPPKSDSPAYGKYMVNAAGCIECHTKVEKGQIIEELAFSGGREFIMPTGAKIISKNITPDSKTGIGDWTKEAFVAKFMMYADSTYKAPSVNPGDFNTIMPWTMYGKMDKEDLEAIYDYLRTVKPIVNEVIEP